MIAGQALRTEQAAARIPAQPHELTTLDELGARARSWLAEREASPDERLIAVAHASIGRMLRGLYVGLGIDETRLLETPQDAFHRLHGGRVDRIDCP